MVDFPDPEEPTKATDSPSLSWKDIFFKTGTSGRCGYANVTLLNATRPVIVGHNEPFDSSVSVPMLHILKRSWAA